MVRTAVGVVVGYISMALLFPILLTLSAVALGPQRVYADESWQPSNVWCLAFIGGALVAAVVGGLVAAAIAASRRGAYALCAVVFVFALSAAIMADPTPPESAPPRPAEMGVLDYLGSARYSRVPTWVNWAYVAVGAAGTIMGAKLYRRRQVLPSGAQHA